MRRYGALHCAFAKQGPQTGELTPKPQRFQVSTRSPSRVVCVWCLEASAEWDAAADGLALRIRKMRPTIGDVHPPSLQDTRDTYVHRDHMCALRVCEHELRWMRPRSAPHCASTKRDLETAFSVIHRGRFRVWTLPLSHAGHQRCVAT